MGWNVLSRMVYLSNYTGKIMKKAFLIILILCAGYGFTFSQDAKVGEKRAREVMKYLPIFKVPQSVYLIYKCVDSTTVERIMSDDSKISYTRYLTMYFTMSQPNAAKEGFSTVEVTVDSAKYLYTEGKKTVYFDSQDEKVAGINYEDLKAFTVPLGKYYDMTYSPYGDVAKIEGEKLDQYFDYLKKNSSGIVDSVERCIWWEGASKSRLEHVTDVKKILLPFEPIELDSVWQTPVHFQVDGINFIDTLKAKITSVQGGFSIYGISTDLKTDHASYRFNGLKGVVLSPGITTGTGNMTLNISSRGTIRKTELNYTMNMVVPVHSDRFTQTIKTKIVWELMAQYKQ